MKNIFKVLTVIGLAAALGGCAMYDDYPPVTVSGPAPVATYMYYGQPRYYSYWHQFDADTQQVTVSNGSSAASHMHYGPPHRSSAASHMHYGPPRHSTAADHVHYGPPR